MAKIFRTDDCPLYGFNGTILFTTDGRKFVYKGGFYKCEQCSRQKNKVIAKISIPNFIICGNHVCPERNMDDAIQEYINEQEALNNQAVPPPSSLSLPPQSSSTESRSSVPKKKRGRPAKKTITKQPRQRTMQSSTRRSTVVHQQYLAAQSSVAAATSNPRPSQMQTCQRSMQTTYQPYGSRTVTSSRAEASPVTSIIIPHPASLQQQQQPSSSLTISSASNSNNLAAFQHRQRMTRSRTNQTAFENSRPPSVNSSAAAAFSRASSVAFDNKLNPSGTTEEEDEIQIIEQEPEVQVIEDMVNSMRIGSNLQRKSQTRLLTRSALAPIQLTLPSPQHQQSTFQKCDVRQHNITEHDEEEEEQHFEHEQSGFMESEGQDENEEKIFAETKYEPALLSFDRPAESALRKACRKLDIAYDGQAYGFWGAINIDVIKIRSDSIKTGFKYHGFDCLALFLTGTANRGRELWTSCNIKLSKDDVMKERYTLVQQLSLTNTFSSEHLKLICYWISCRIGIYEVGELNKYGNWEDHDAMIILIEKDGDRYSPIFEL